MQEYYIIYPLVKTQSRQENNNLFLLRISRIVNKTYFFVYLVWFVVNIFR
jgi:hypothetical protein